MGALPSVHRFYAEDYQKSDDEFKRFLGQLNLFTDPVYQILNSGIDVQTNTNEEFYTIEIPTAASGGPTNNNFVFTPKKFVGKPNGVIVCQCIYNTLDGLASAIGSPVTIDWIWSGSQVRILAVYGITSGLNYTLVVRIC